MPRRRLAVALLLPGPLATEIDGIRRACGDPRLGRIAPHITLVPPVNVVEERVGAVLDHCCGVAASIGVLRLTLGAPSTFAPATPLAWLSVGGDVESVRALRQRLDAGPLARPPDHAFVPHVTISGQVASERLDAMLAALGDFDATCTIDRLHVLANRQLTDGRWGWVPLADAPFARPTIIGVGGLALELSVGAVLEPDAQALVDAEVEVEGAVGSLVVTARRDGGVVGVATGTTRGWLAVLGTVVVGEGHRGQGIGSQLLAHFTIEAARRDCRTAAHMATSEDPVAGLCRQRGWTGAASAPAGGVTTLVRSLPSH